MDVDYLQELAGDRGSKLLGVVAAGSAGEFAVEIELVNGRETPVLRIGPRVRDGEEQKAPLNLGVPEQPVELQYDLGPGWLIAVDSAADADRRPVAAAGDLVDCERGIASVRVGGKGRPKDAGGVRHKQMSLLIGRPLRFGRVWRRARAGGGRGYLSN